MFNKNEYEDIETVLISCGVNDIDYLPGSKVHEEIISLIQFIKQKYPNIKIVLNHLTPRKDDLDSEVIKCNYLLDESIRNLKDVFIVNQNSLRDDNYSKLYDNKHIKKSEIRHFVANIKGILRLAHGMEQLQPRPYYNNSDISNNKSFYTSQENRYYNGITRNVQNIANEYSNVREYNNIDNRMRSIANYNDGASIINKEELIHQVIDTLKVLLR